MEVLDVAWLMVGTVAVTLFGVLAGVLAMTLWELRSTLRSTRHTIEAVTPPSEEALENLRDVSESAARAAKGLEAAASVLEDAKRAGSKLSPWLPLVAGAAGIATTAFARGRRRGGGNDEDDDRRRDSGGRRRRR